MARFTITSIDAAAGTIEAMASVANRAAGYDLCSRFPDRDVQLLAAWTGEPIVEASSNEVVGVALAGEDTHVLVRIQPKDAKMIRDARVGSTFRLDGVE